MNYSIPLDDDFDLKVGAHTIHVRLVDSSNDGLGDSNHGTWVPGKYTIFLSKDDPYSIRLSTFLHELIHVFEGFYEIKISHKDLNLVGDALTQVIMDNFQETRASRSRKKK